MLKTSEPQKFCTAEDLLFMVIINITTIITFIILPLYIFTPDILYIPNTTLPKIPITLQYNLEGPTICS